MLYSTHAAAPKERILLATRLLDSEFSFDDIVVINKLSGVFTDR